MKITDSTLNGLALALSAERKRQKLSREDAAAVCGVSASFIRDAESNPENCSLGKIAKLINGLGLRLEAVGLLPSEGPSNQPQGLMQLGGRTAPASKGVIGSAMGLHQATGLCRIDFGVPESQLVLSKAKDDQP